MVFAFIFFAGLYWFVLVALVILRHRREKSVTCAERSLLQNSDYDVFLSPLDDFKKKMEEAGLGDKVVYLDRKDRYDFLVRDR